MSSSFFFGKGTDRIFIRSNLGVAEYKDNGGSWIAFKDIGGSGSFQLKVQVDSSTALVPIDGNYDKSFIIGSYLTSYLSNSSYFTRMFFHKVNGSFRAGQATGTQWDTLGAQSVAFGYNCVASGAQATAMGYACNATSSQAFAGGYGVTVNQTYSIGYGMSFTVSGRYSAVFGSGHTTASASRSIIAGASHVASGNYNAVFGTTNTVSGDGCLCSGLYGNMAKNYGAGSGVGFKTTQYVSKVHASGRRATSGDNQLENVHVYGVSTTTTAVSLYPGNSSSYDIVIPQDNTAYAIHARIFCVVYKKNTGDAVVGSTFDIKLDATVLRMSTTSVKAQTKTVVFRDANMGSCDANITVAGSSIRVSVVGVVGCELYWHGYLELHSIIFS